MYTHAFNTTCVHSAQERDGIPIQLDLAARSGRNVTFSCPYDVGRLSGCYFGGWSKDMISIIQISNPGPGCRDIRGTPTNQKYLLDRSTFSLTIINLMPADGGNYTCELSLVDPQSPVGQTVPFTPLIAHTLSVDGEFACQPLTIQVALMMRTSLHQNFSISTSN